MSTEHDEQAVEAVLGFEGPDALAKAITLAFWDLIPDSALAHDIAAAGRAAAQAARQHDQETLAKVWHHGWKAGVDDGTRHGSALYVNPMLRSVNPFRVSTCTRPDCEQCAQDAVERQAALRDLGMADQ